MVRKEGLEPSRCYPQVPETCASTNSATFAGRAIVAAEVVIVKEPVDPQVPASQAGEAPNPLLRVYQFRHFRGESDRSCRGRDRQGTGAGHPYPAPVQNLSAPGRAATAALKATPELRAARLPIPPLSRGGSWYRASARRSRDLRPNGIAQSRFWEIIEPRLPCARLAT